MAKSAKVIDIATRKIRTEPFFHPSAYELLALRTDLGFSQEAFGAFLGTSFATVNRWERGHAEPRGLLLTFLRALQTAKRRDRRLGEQLVTWSGRSQAYMMHRVFLLACRARARGARGGRR